MRHLVLTVFLWAQLVTSEAKVGDLSTLRYQVAGSVYVLDDKRLAIKNFNYNGKRGMWYHTICPGIFGPFWRFFSLFTFLFSIKGKGPDAYIYVGTELPVGPSGVLVPLGSTQPLTRYDNQDVTLTLPGDLTTSQLKWLSVWCKQFSVDFGHVVFPKTSDNEIQQPEPENSATSNNSQLAIFSLLMTMARILG